MPFILVVDDDEDIIDSLTLVLADQDFEVAAAATHDEAVALAHRHQPVVTLLDWNIPGLDVARLVADLRTVSAARIVLCTGADQAHERARAVGVDGVLTKPFSIETLLETVRRMAAAEAEVSSPE